MDLRINTISNRVSVADAASPLPPETLDTIVEAVLSRFEQRLATRQMAEDERDPQASVAPRPWSA
jgi:hypothetical protein